MKIKGAKCPGQAKAALMMRIISAPDYSPQKLNEVFTQFLDWLTQVEEQGVYSVDLHEAIESYLSMQSPEAFIGGRRVAT